MKIAHVGATGNSGSRIVVEALRRGHEVTAISRHPAKVKRQAGSAFTSVRISNSLEG